MAWPTRFGRHATWPPIVAPPMSMMGAASRASAASHAPPSAIALIQRWAAASAAAANSEQTTCSLGWNEERSTLSESDLAVRGAAYPYQRLAAFGHLQGPGEAYQVIPTSQGRVNSVMASLGCWRASRRFWYSSQSRLASSWLR